VAAAGGPQKFAQGLAYETCVRDERRRPTSRAGISSSRTRIHFLLERRLKNRKRRFQLAPYPPIILSILFDLNRITSDRTRTQNFTFGRPTTNRASTLKKPPRLEQLPTQRRTRTTKMTSNNAVKPCLLRWARELGEIKLHYANQWDAEKSGIEEDVRYLQKIAEEQDTGSLALDHDAAEHLVSHLEEHLMKTKKTARERQQLLEKALAEHLEKLLKDIVGQPLIPGYREPYLMWNKSTEILPGRCSTQPIVSSTNSRRRRNSGRTVAQAASCAAKHLRPAAAEALRYLPETGVAKASLQPAK